MLSGVRLVLSEIVTSPKELEVGFHDGMQLSRSEKATPSLLEEKEIDQRSLNK